MNLPGHFEPDNRSAPDPPSYNGFARRPWSPIRYDEDITDVRDIRDYIAQDHIPGSIPRGGRHTGLRRDASEDSVEALDLAVYARTLRRPMNDRDSPYPPFPHTSHIHPLSVPTPVHANRQGTPQLSSFASYPEYPPSPDNDLPFSAQSRDTFSQAPPSLVSGDTSHDTHESYGSRYPYPTRRPYSLPPFFASMSANHLPDRRPAIFSATSGSPHQSLVRIASPMFGEREEADISRFPAFSRSWYEDSHKNRVLKHSSLPPYSSEPQYVRGGSWNPLSSSASNQSRDILPWSSQLPEADGPPIDQSIKEERIRMLEHEFGKKSKAGNEDFGEPVVGSVDEKGILVTAGPKKRIGARWAQGLLALITGVSSLYGALFIKSSTPAPPASKLPAFALYVSSVVTFFLIFYLFALRPCCCGKRRKSGGPTDSNMGGMMVLPVQGFPGGKKKKKNKKGKNKYGGGGGGGDVQVNLIVDPGVFGGGGRGRDAEYGSDEEFDVDGSQAPSGRRGGRSQLPQRRSIFQGLAMESDWNAARKFLKQMLFIDISCLLLWAGVFILILLGKKCPPGGFNGWCDSYNIASATACILCVAFGFGVFFDIKDLHMSKASPRTRT